MKGYSRSKSDFREILYHKYFTMDEIINWCYGLGDSPKDYILTEWLLDALPTLYQKDEVIYQYNQWKQDWSKKSCTIFSPIWAISSLFNVEIPLTTIKMWDNDTYSNGRTKDSGWLVAKWVDHIVKEWNNSDFWKKYGKAAYYSIDLKDDELVKKVLDKRYSICTWYQWNATYNNDYKSDWVLNGTEFGNSTYGHAVEAIWSINGNPCRIQDNYYGTAKYNIYDIAHKFSEIPCFYTRWYVITKVAEDALEEIKRLNELKTECLNCIASLWNIWHMTNDKNFQWVLHYTADKLRAKVKDCDDELRKYS